MRPIKFRAWLSDKVYVEPRMVTWDELISCFDAITIFDAKNMTLMQYTGLKDKNGTPIYEGDVLDCINGAIPTINTSFYRGRCLGQVGTVAGRTIVWPRPIENGQRMHYPCETLKDGEIKYAYENEVPAMACEVLGNVFENPELLEVAEHD